MRRPPLPLLLLPLVLPGPLVQGQGEAAMPALEFRRYHSVEQVEELFEALAARHPRWFRSESIGLSVQQRPIPLLVIGDREADGERRAMWVDGAIHGGELASAEPALALVEALRARIAAGDPPAWLERVVVFVVPVINVDGRHASMTPPYPYQRRNLRPHDDDGDGLLDEDGPADLNGDGRASRVLVPSGYEYQRGDLEARDEDGDGRCGEDPPGGVDLNRDFPVARAERPAGWRPEPETAAVVAFWERHPEIALAFSYHTSARMLIHPPVTPDEHEALRYERVTGLYEALVGGSVLGPTTGFSGLVGTTMEWFHSARGAVALTVEVDLPWDGTRGAERARDVVRHPCLGRVAVERIEEGYAREAQNRHEADLPGLVAPHVAFLQAAGGELAGWEPQAEDR